MKLTLSLIAVILLFSFSVHSQKRRTATMVRPPEIGKTGIILDETLSVLREKPSLFANAVQRMRRGRELRILGVAEADGVKFYRVSVPPSNSGWVQADAVFGKFRLGDEERLARLVQAADKRPRARSPRAGGSRGLLGRDGELLARNLGRGDEPVPAPALLQEPASRRPGW